MPSSHIKSTTPVKVVSGGPGTTTEAFTDNFQLRIIAADSNATPLDNSTFDINLALSDSNAGQTEAVSLTFPEGNYFETNPPPSEGQSFTVRVWLANSAGSGVTNPTNANGQNNGTNAQVQTAIAGSATETLTSDIGTSIGTVSFSSVIYRGWYTFATTLLTSSCQLIAHSSSALFTDIVMDSLSAVGGSTDHSSGDFSFDLLAAGVDTIAKLQSLQILHRTTDAVAGVTPATINVDAGAVDLTGVF